MKILLFVSSLSLKYGGPSRSVPGMAKGLSEAGVDVTLMTLYSDDMNIHSLDGTNVKLVSLKKKFDRVEFKRTIIRDKIDLVQIQSLWNPEYHLMAKICRKMNIPYIITPRGMLEPWSMKQKKWKKNLAMLLYQRFDLNHAACIYTTSDMEAQHIRDLNIKAPCSVIPNGIEINRYPCRDFIKKVKKQVLFLSRIHVKKGIEILINAWERIVNDYSDWSLLIVGNGEQSYIDSLKMMINEKNLSNYISIIPPVFGVDKIELYQSSALFVLPSYSENFGMVIAEALSSGVPVITTNNTPWEMLNGDAYNNRLGWCIDLSVENLERSLREALSMDFSNLYNMGQQGSAFVKKSLDYKVVADKAKQLYAWLLYGEVKPNYVYGLL